ncbi:MAG: glycosyltransferase [bacterium]
MKNKKITKKEKISFIASIYNIEDTVESLYKSSKKMLEHLTDTYEMIFVDDGSNDKTCHRLKGISENDQNVKIIRMRSVFGEACALDAGLKYSDGGKIIFYSGRVMVNLKDIDELIKKLSSGHDLVVGWRSPRKDSSINKMVSFLFNKLVSVLSGCRLHDINSGIIVSYRYVFDNISFYGNLYNFIPVLSLQQGYKVAEEKIEQIPGSYRTSRNPKEYLRRMLDIVTVFFLTKYSKKPIHFLGLLGTIFIVLGMIIELYLFFYRIFLIGPIAGRPLLILGALLLVIGIQMISIGLIGEMIIFTHAGDIKEYNIKEVI